MTEPQVASVISKALSAESALFIGNSMAIRDADMYGCGWSGCSHNIASMISKLQLPCHMIRVAGNRGASGIDGLLSTAVGFAVGCNKRVSFFVLVSFLGTTIVYSCELYLNAFSFVLCSGALRDWGCFFPPRYKWLGNCEPEVGWLSIGFPGL